MGSGTVPVGCRAICCCTGSTSSLAGSIGSEIVNAGMIKRRNGTSIQSQDRHAASMRLDRVAI
ncbi:MAG: hypothetical protein ACYTGC_20115 [Planctomycetota bacterium]|jgi:hypothetical protein